MSRDHAGVVAVSVTVPMVVGVGRLGLGFGVVGAGELLGPKKVKKNARKV